MGEIYCIATWSFVIYLFCLLFYFLYCIIVMNPFYMLYFEIIYRPILNILVVFLALTSGNLWLSIIFLTILVRLILLPSSSAGNDISKQMTDIQPKIAEIQEKYKDDPTKMSEETMKLMKTQWMWPLKWCLMMLLQLPIFIGLYNAISSYSSGSIQSSELYSFFHRFGYDYLSLASINHIFMGIDLFAKSAPANLWLAILGAVMIFVQTQLTMMIQPKPATPQMIDGKPAPDMSGMMKYMNIFLVIMMGSFIYGVQAGVGLYIVVTTWFGLLQYIYQYRLVLQTKRLAWRSRS